MVAKQGVLLEWVLSTEPLLRTRLDRDTIFGTEVVEVGRMAETPIHRFVTQKP